ncbi:MAG: hypothetical protein IJ188_02970 [Clostridia bacterium]|nr:hypothetical protein [Clostridia bacterium]
MTRERVDELLKRYKPTLARCEYLRGQLEVLQAALEENKQQMIGDQVSMSQAITGMPHGTTVGDPVGNLALDIAMGNVSVFVKQVEEEIATIQDELSRSGHLLSCVDKWMNGLSDREKLAVQEKTFNDSSWAQIVYVFSREFGGSCSKRSAQRIYDRAMEKIYEMAA